MFWRKRRESDFAEEIESHLALEAERLRDQGLSPSEAEAAARRQFGNVTRAEERFYESGRWLWWEDLKRDVIYAGRVLLRNPGFTLVAVLSLALGIGANSLVFSVVNALVLRPLPVEHPEQLVSLESNFAGPGISFPDYRDLRDRNQTFAGLIALRVAPMELDSSDGANRIWGYLATGNYFDVLGMHPALGRFFHAEDDLHPGASPYAILSYASWQQRFGGDSNIVGKTIRINRQPFTVLGVAGKRFHGTELFYWPEVWVPMMMEPQIEVGNPWLENRSDRNPWVLGRLRPGVSTAQAKANLNGIAAELVREYPDDQGLKFQVARPGLMGDTIGASARAFALGVMVLAGLVLLAACTNLASLLTARTADRQREIAIRLSLGASRGRVVRQMLTETFVLSFAGGAAGYGLAVLLSRALSNWRAPLEFPVQVDVNPDWKVFFFACAVSLCAGIVFGLVPAGRASRTDPNAVLKGESSSWRVARLALRDVLVVVQVALCFVLVSGCLLSLRGLQQALTMRLGFQPQGVSVVSFELGMAGYTEEQGKNFQRRALQSIEQLPGVSTAAYSNSIPLSIDQSQSSSFSEDLVHPRPGDAISAYYYEVSPNFFHTLGTEVLEGRDFTWLDDAKSPRVALVNLAFARRVLHTDHPLGKRFRFGLGGDPVQVIGLVENGKYQNLTEGLEPAVFRPILQWYNCTTTLIVRAQQPETGGMVRQMRQAVTRLDPHLPVYGTGSLEQMLGLVFLPTRAAAIALSAFGLLALMLAATGIHGLVSYAVARRVREIGIRIAVGARPAQVVVLVLGKTLVLVASGATIGAILALAAGQILSSIVYQASPRDPVVFAAVIATLALLGLASCWAPVRRAVRVDPMIALRHE